MRIEVLGAERRRWDDQKKLDIVMSVGIAGTAVTGVAQWYEVPPQPIYTWRREVRSSPHHFDRY